MSAPDLVVVLVSVVTFGLLLVVVRSLSTTNSALRDLGASVDELRGDMIGTISELRRTGEHARGEPDRVDAFTDSEDRDTDTVDSPPRLRALAPPLIKSKSIIAGTAEVARRLRRAEGAPATGRAEGAPATGRAEGAPATGRAEGAPATGRAEGAPATGRAEGAPATGRAEGAPATGRAEGAPANGRAEGMAIDVASSKRQPRR